MCVLARAATCDDGIALVVESAGEDLVSMALQDLQTDSRVNVPKTGRPVRGGCEEPSTLGTEAHLQGAAAKAEETTLVSLNQKGLEEKKKTQHPLVKTKKLWSKHSTLRSTGGKSLPSLL